jgi:hypothetical protein
MDDFDILEKLSGLLQSVIFLFDEFLMQDKFVSRGMGILIHL